MVVLLNNPKISVISDARRIRVLIASADPERVVLVGNGLRAWPEAVVTQVAASRVDAVDQVNRHTPHILCWDARLGEDLPASTHGICALLLGDESCTVSDEQSWEMPIPEAYVEALLQSINREYELRRLLVQARSRHFSETRLQSSMPPSSPPALSGVRVSEDRLRAVGRLAAGLAHEVNNPLTFVLANLESLRESHQVILRFIRTLKIDLSTQEAITPQSFEKIMADANLKEVLDDVADMLSDCYKGTHRIQDIARSIRTFSRADDKLAELVDINRLVDDACAMVFNQIRYRARLVKRSEPIPMIAAFPGRIAQALVNMLTNAAESIEGGSYERHRIVVSTRVEGDKIVVAVSDTGAGIPEGNRARIFTPGFTTKAQHGRMGLGLGVCRRVGAEHGGKLEVHHLADRGTRFELILPIDTGLATVEQRRDSRPTSEVPSKRARLLIVDDDAMVLSALRRRLQRRYDTVTVLGGAEALARLAEDPGFDSILCDLIMPEVDGKSFYEAVEQDHPQLADRIVFMSGGAFTPRLRKFAASVSNPVLQKPVTREDIESILSAVRADSE
jgi:signal transduction histidine kinase/CheY-like chemotaxis protein